VFTLHLFALLREMAQPPREEDLSDHSSDETMTAKIGLLKTAPQKKTHT
jgi:hypothetical protein